MQTDRLKQLATLFLQRGTEEMRLLREYLPAARAAQPEALLEIQRIAHRLSGSGAMLGFKFISECAAQIERILRRAEPAPSETDWQVILTQLQGIEAELARSMAAAPAQ